MRNTYIYRTLPFLSIALSAVFLCTVATGAEMNAKGYWKQGSRDAESKLYKDAVANFTRAIKANKGEVPPGDIAKIFNERGLAHLEMNEYERAASDFENAVRLDDENGKFPANLGRVALIEKRYGEAYGHFSDAIRLDPRNAEYYANRGLVSFESGDYDRAIDDYTRVLVHDQTQGMAYYYRGIAYKKKLKTEDALRDFDRVLDRYPRHADAFYQKAAIFARMKKVDVACIMLEEAVRNGYSSWTVIKENPDFDVIRRTDCYLSVMRGK